MSESLITFFLLQAGKAFSLLFFPVFFRRSRKLYFYNNVKYQSEQFLSILLMFFVFLVIYEINTMITLQ